MRELAGCVQVVADEVGAFPRRFNIAGVDQVAPGAHLESYDVLDDPSSGLPELLVMTLPEISRPPVEIVRQPGNVLTQTLQRSDLIGLAGGDDHLDGP